MDYGLRWYRVVQLVIGLCSGFLLWAMPALAADGAPRPILDIGKHTAAIRDVVFSPNGRQVVSASDDKTIRVWELATGKTVRVIRGGPEASDKGEVFALALSPNGGWLAAGGNFGTGFGSDNAQPGIIRLYDFATGKLIALLRGHEDVVNGLAFASDGQHIISGSADGTAIIWDVAAFADVPADSAGGARIVHPQYRLPGHNSEVRAVAFTPDGHRAVTASDDHTLRLWRVEDGKQIALMVGYREKVWSLAVALDGTILSGDWNGEIRLWNGSTGVFRKTLARQGTMVGHLSVTPNGERLLSTTGTAGGEFASRVFDLRNGKEILTYTGHDFIVLAAAISPDEQWAATGGGNNNELHIWDLRTGERRRGPDGQPLMLGTELQLAFAAVFGDNDRSIAWGNADPCPARYSCPETSGTLQHVLELPSAENPSAIPRPIRPDEISHFRRAELDHGEWSLKHRGGGSFGNDAILEIRRNGQLVSSIERDAGNGYGYWAYSFTPDGQTIISGGNNGVLSAYNRKGEKLGDFIGHEDVVWVVVPSADGRYLLSTSADHTIRLWSLTTRKLLATLYYSSDSDWQLWTPKGFYIGSTDGEGFIRWRVNEETVGVDDPLGAQLRAKFHRPDLVATTVQLGDEANGQP